MLVIAGVTALITSVIVQRAFAHERALLRSPSPDAENLTRRLGHVDREGRLAMAQTHALLDSWERRVADAAALTVRIERREALSDAVDEVSRVLDGGADWPTALLRIQGLISGFLTLLAVFLRGPLDAAAAFGAGMVGVGVVAAKRHRSRGILKRQRELADRLLTLLDPDETEVLGARGPRSRAK